MTNHIKQTAERAVKTFVQAWLGAWVVAGSDFDAITNQDNLKVAVVAVVASLAMSFGLKKVGPDKDSPSIV